MVLMGTMTLLPLVQSSLVYHHYCTYPHLRKMDNRLEANESIFHLNAVSECISLASSPTSLSHRRLIKILFVEVCNR